MIDKYVQQSTPVPHAYIYARYDDGAAELAEMKMIEIVFEELKRQGIVSSGRDFSEDWLGMEGSYYRAVRTRHRTASVRAIVTCAAKLKRRADALGRSSLPQVQVQAANCNALADRCLSELLAGCKI